jgi:hypothetical protein
MRAVDLAVEKNDPYIARELCISGQDTEGPEVDVQQACEGYQELSIKLVNSSEDAYVLRDMCNFGSEAGLPEDVIQKACERGIELVVDYDDPYLLKDMCYSGHETESGDDIEVACNLAVGLAIKNEDIDLIGDLCLNIRQGNVSTKDFQQACDGYQDLSIKLVDSSSDAYVLSKMCIIGFDAGLPEEVIQMACERGVELAVGSDDPYLLRDMCYKGRETGLGSDDVDVACNLAVELAIQDEDVDLIGDLCWSNRLGRLSESSFQRVCEEASNRILPGEQMSSFLDPGTFELWSFQGFEGQTVTITLNSGSNDLILNLIMYDPRGDLIIDHHTDSNNLIISIDQLQLAQSGIYVIGVYFPDEGSGEYNLEFTLGDAGQ